MTADTAISVLVSQVKSAVAGMTPLPTVGMGWPTNADLALVAQKGARLVSVFDKGIASNTTRWAADPVLDTPGVLGISSTVSSAIIPAGQSATITVGLQIGQSAPQPNDAISLLLALGKQQVGYVAIQQTGDDTAAIAARLAALVTSSWVSVGVAGSVITVTNNTQTAIAFGSYAGNIATRIIDGARILRTIDVIVWATSAVDRNLVADTIMPTLVKLKVNFGAQASNGEWVRLNYCGDLYQDVNVKSKIYERHMMVQVEYSETFPDTIYSVLAPILTEQVQSNVDGSIMNVT